jgi:hypothetical protein
VRISGSKWLNLVLLVVMLTMPAVGQDASLMVGKEKQSQPAACHRHGTRIPGPQPVTYRCCQSGHDSAILQNSAVWQLDSFDFTVFAERGHILVTVSRVPKHRDGPPSSSDPPDLTPLRI